MDVKGTRNLRNLYKSLLLLACLLLFVQVLEYKTQRIFFGTIILPFTLNITSFADLTFLDREPISSPRGKGQFTTKKHELKCRAYHRISRASKSVPCPYPQHVLLDMSVDDRVYYGFFRLRMYVSGGCEVR